jgi:hypothetical protein
VGVESRGVALDMCTHSLGMSVLWRDVKQQKRTDSGYDGELVEASSTAGLRRPTWHWPMQLATPSDDTWPAACVV